MKSGEKQVLLLSVIGLCLVNVKTNQVENENDHEHGKDSE